MSHPGTGPWRVLILDRDRTDPKWLLCTVARPGDVRPAQPGIGTRRADPGAAVDEMTTAWVASASGLYRPTLIPLPAALAWRVDEGGTPR
jgi:hypothetical protein